MDYSTIAETLEQVGQISQVDGLTLYQALSKSGMVAKSAECAIG